MPNNGDKGKTTIVNGAPVVGLGSFHKTLPHNAFGEVKAMPYAKLLQAAAGSGSGFKSVPAGTRLINGQPKSAKFTNPQAGLAKDRLIKPPTVYSMPPAPTVNSDTIAAEMVELYWMSLLRDVSLDKFESTPLVKSAAKEVNQKFKAVTGKLNHPELLRTGVDVPGSASARKPIKPHNLFRLGLPGDDIGPLISQFLVRDLAYGAQRIDQQVHPYKAHRNYLTQFPDWLDAQNAGLDVHGQDYSGSNENSAANFETHPRHIATMRDMARFVNKDALHQAYFNATIALLSGKADWNIGNPYLTGNSLAKREAGFGVLGGPHILALVSEVATRALKAIWHQKWQEHLRLRPEAYGGLLHVQNVGVGPSKTMRAYGLPKLAANSQAATLVRKDTGGLLLPMAFTQGSPAHPSYGAGHATVAGACVAVLKAFFNTFSVNAGNVKPVPFSTLKERGTPYGMPKPIKSYVTGVQMTPQGPMGFRKALAASVHKKLTIEGELNKLAANVAMGRSFGGVHWRTDNTRSLILGEALAAQILADITTDAKEKPEFKFRTFARKANGNPKIVTIKQGKILVDGIQAGSHPSEL